MHKPDVSVVWLKRDLRLHDNEAFYLALKSDYPVLLLYLFEPCLLEHDHYSRRHFRFLIQSINDLNDQLLTLNTCILAIRSVEVNAFTELQKHVNIQGVYSHRETGVKVTYDRDIAFDKWCRENGVQITISIHPWPVQIQYGDANSIQVQFWSEFVRQHRVGLINHFPVFFGLNTEMNVIEECYQKGDVHWNAKGSEVAARTILDYLENYYDQIRMKHAD